ncbi:MAG: lraT [Caulobacter sp.]|nr:lraT [Caulobacter sp.]
MKIGGAAGFSFDSLTAVPQLLDAGVDVLIFDYMAELAMARMAQAREADAAFAGYPRDFIDEQLAPNIERIVAGGVKVIANAGGLNPRACAAAIEALLAEKGLKAKVGFVEGDDLTDRAGHYRDRGAVDMFTGAAFPPSVDSFNAYLGAFPIAACLARGADIVVTGRVVDSALSLGPLIHAFGWGPGDHDLLAAGTLIGHVLECGPQAVGGTHTDWRAVPDWTHMGYPIAECAADGSFVLSKPQGTGGLVSVGALAEQILYEVSDPASYLVPDVAADFSQVRITPVEGREALHVTGARGRAPGDRLKACLTWRDGWRGVALQTLIGMDAVPKAERQGAAVVARTEAVIRARGLSGWRRSLVQVLGGESAYAPARRNRTAREAIARIVVEHDDRRAIDLFQREHQSTATAGSVGTSLVAGTSTAPVGRLFSTLIPKSDVTVIVSVDGEERVLAPMAAAPGAAPGPERPAPPPAPGDIDPAATVPLLALAFVRSGDKGDLFNLAVIARRPEWLAYLHAALTPQVIAGWYAHVFEPGATPRVDRYLAPGLNALNFVLHDSLGGGGQSSMRLDSVAKGMGQQLLDFPAPVSAAMAAALEGVCDGDGLGLAYEGPA